MIQGIWHIAVSTKDMERSLWFYCDVLGGIHMKELSIEEPAGQPLIEIVQFRGECYLELFYPRKEHPLGEELGRNHFCLYTDDIFALEERLGRYWVLVTTQPQMARDKNLQMWIQDPNGYRVEIMQVTSDCPLLKKKQEV